MRRTSAASAAQASPDDTLQALIATLGNRRPIEPRLVGGFRHAPCVPGDADPEDLIPLARCSTPPAPGTDAFDELSDAGRALLSPNAEAATGPLLHARGIWHLIWLDDEEGVDRAVHDLETAATLATADDRRSAAAFSDLAAAYLARAAVKDQPLDLILALDASGKALEREPALAEALFNHALSIEALHLRTEARTAWEDVLNAEPTGPWADEARDHLRRLEEPTVLEAWKVQRPLLERAARQGDTEEVDRLVAAFGPPVRDWIEEDLLPAWGEAELAGEATEAAEVLTVARSAADALVRLVGEHMPADAIAAIDRADEAGRQRLAEAHRDFGEGMERYGAQDCTGATESFEAAEPRLEREGSPLALRAVLQKEICTYYNAPEVSIEVLSAVQKDRRLDRYPTLRGRIDWVIGLCRGEQDQLLESAEHYRSGMESLRTIGDPDAGAVYGYIARVKEFLGMSREEWNVRFQALKILAPEGDPRRFYIVLHEIVSGLLMEDRPDLATHFQNEVLAQARAWNEPGPLAEAFLTRWRIRQAVGDGIDARSDLQEADDTLNAVPEGPIRDRLETDLRAERGQSRVETDPRSAIRDLTDAIDRYGRIRHTARIPDLLLSRASASLALDDIDAAQNDLDTAIEQHEARFAEAPPRLENQTVLRTAAHEAYDARVALSLDRRADPIAALGWSDRARGRELRRPSWTDDAIPLREDELLGMVPAGVTAVEYAVLPDRVVLWVLGRRLRTIVRPISAPALEHRVDALRALIEAQAPEREIETLSSDLFDDLVRPVVDVASPGDALLIVPDRALHRLPFAALWDRAQERYLIEQHPLVEAPSLALAFHASPRSNGQRARPSVLAVGASAFDRSRYPRLSPIPGAAQEARAVAGYYADQRVLDGAAATPASFLNLAPTASVIHLAAHAVISATTSNRPELLLAPDPNGHLDGALSADSLAHLDLSATEIVFLSTCTGISDPGLPARSGVSGLARAFLTAGAQGVIANRWSADDETSIVISKEFHRALSQGKSPVIALREAQLALKRSTRPGWSQPMHWADAVMTVTDRLQIERSGIDQPGT